MATIKLDPVTRLEGHMKIEVEIDDNKKVISAKSTGNMFRGFETLLRGRDPRDAVHITQRICGLCPVSHSVAAVKAIEMSQNFKPTGQARLLRNLIQGGNFLSDHILHFYHLTLMDFVRGPERSPWVTNARTDIRFSKSASERIFKSYIKALEIRRKAHEMVSIFSGKIPHVMSIMPGGVTKTPTALEISQYKALLKEVKDFVDNEYYHDVQKIASVYKDYFEIGKGYGNFISFGLFEVEGGNEPKSLFRAGRYTNGQYWSVDIDKVTEDVSHAWYEDVQPQSVKALGTNPKLDKDKAYSWIKAPRYMDIPHEAGPLARMWLNGDYRKGTSVMDRHVARMLESKKIAQALSIWVDQLIPGQQEYNPTMHQTSVVRSGEGVGMTEAPRGALVHYIKYENNLIQNYQVVTPTCWNASPRDHKGQMGPLEEALVGVQIKDKDNPVELIRIVHSFDPCTACAVHIIDAEKGIKKDFIVSTPNPMGIL